MTTQSSSPKTTTSEEFLLTAHLIPYEEAEPKDWLEWATTVG